jgi:hypothetical protein
MLLVEWLQLIAKWEGVFSQQRVWHRARRLALGLVVGLGLRTITRALGAVGREQKPWSSDYRVFSRSPWRIRALFAPIVAEAVALQGDGPLVVAGDYTHLVRPGRRVQAARWTRDPMSPPFHVNLVRAVRFFQLAFIVPCRPAAPRAVPVAFAESPVPKKPGKRADAASWAAYRQEQKRQPAAVAAREEIVALREYLDQQGAAQRGLLVALDGSFRSTAASVRDAFCRSPSPGCSCYAARAKMRCYAAERWKQAGVFMRRRRSLRKVSDRMRRCPGRK